MDSGSSSDRLVVGVDFGTTFSGIAEAYTGKAIPTADEIQVIKQWPGARGTIEQVPSELSYGAPKKIKPTATSLDRPQRSVTRRPQSGLLDFSELSVALRGAQSGGNGNDAVRWGYMLDHDEVRLRCMKLFLDSKQEIPAYISKTDMHEQLKKSKKDAEAAVTDYLTEMFKHARQMLVRRYGEYFISTTKISVVLTVPAVWSDAAKDATLRAAQKAGTTAKFSMAKQLTLISEPEAAAVYTLQAIQPNLLRVNDNFIVCDAGGGTVDLISYEIKQLSPLRLEESAEGTGKCCGAAFLNMRFEQHVRNKLGEAVFLDVCEKRPKAWLAALRGFEEHVKPNYNPDEETEFSISFPGVPDNASAGIEQGFLIMTSAEVGEIFHPIIKEVVGLVDQQMSKLKAKNKKVSGILLVGGFGQNEALYKALRDKFEGDGAPPPPYSPVDHNTGSAEHGLQVMQPPNAWSAVVRGAVLRGIEGTEYVLSRKARNNYGVTCTESYDADLHNSSAKYWSEFDEEWRVRDRMRWFIRKGSTVSSSEPTLFPFYTNFSDLGSSMYRTKLVFSKIDDAPDDYDASPGSNTETLCRLEVDLDLVPHKHWTFKNTSDGSRFKRLDFNLGMHVKSGNITFDLRIDGVVYGEVSATFE